MKTKANEHHKAHNRHSSEIKSLEDVAMRQVVNQMKIKMEQQRLMLAIMPGGVSTDQAMATTASRFEELLQYVTLGVTTYRIIKKGIALFRSLKN